MKQKTQVHVGLWVRLAETDRESLRFFLNGHACRALVGDTILTALLTQSRSLGQNEASGSLRAGFCVMGACQDCWVTMEDGARLRSCLRLIEPEMRLVVEV